jgi:hypothetical protein
MKMPQVRITMAHLVGMIAIVAIGLVPFNNPTQIWLGCLMYVKFSVIVAATFLARYGKNRDWWFGFAALGASYTLLSVPGLWHAVSYLGNGNEFDYFDLTGDAGRLVASLKAQQQGGSGPNSDPRIYAAIVQFWGTMAMSFIGGYLSLAIASRRVEGAQVTDNANPES